MFDTISGYSVLWVVGVQWKWAFIMSCLFELVTVTCCHFQLTHLSSFTLTLGTDTVHWSKCVKYLGVRLVSGRTRGFDVNPIRRSFFAACNAIYSQSARMDNILQLSLMESYCLPILAYAASAVTYKTRQLDDLNSCWNSMYRKIFGFNLWESVRAFINGLARLDLKHICVLYKCRWICKARRCTELIQNF